MGYIKLIANHAGQAISDIIPVGRFRRGAAAVSKPDEFVHCASDVIPKKLQAILDTLGPSENSQKEFLTELYSAGAKKFDYIYTHEYFQGSVPYFNDKAFIDVVKKMPEKELKKTFDEITELYKTLPEQSFGHDKVTKELIYQPQTPKAGNLAQLTILKAHNKEAYEYIMTHQNKEVVSHLLETFDNGLNGSTFETLTVAQIRQLEGCGRVNSLNFQNPEDSKIIQNGLTAEERFVLSSDMFYQHPEDMQNLHKFLSKQTITEPFTAFRAEKDTGMFSSVPLDKGMARKVKVLALKNIFNARKIKVHEYSGNYQNFKYTDLFSHIMASPQLTLADAMQVAKYGNEKFRMQLIELIKNTQIPDSRFKSLTFDGGFAKDWVCTQDGHTKILQNMQVNKGLHGKYSNSDNRQAEFILNNDPKIMSFQDVKYDPKYDVFYFDSSISAV